MSDVIHNDCAYFCHTKKDAQDLLERLEHLGVKWIAGNYITPELESFAETTYYLDENWRLARSSSWETLKKYGVQVVDYIPYNSDDSAPLSGWGDLIAIYAPQNSV